MVGLSGLAAASTGDDIAAIEAAKQQRFSMHDSGGGWGETAKFNPVLAQYSKETGLSVSPFSLDGKGDDFFPNVMLATPEMMVEFFGHGLLVATPTTFLVNLNTMSTYPLLQGDVDRQGLASRIDDVLRTALDKGEK